MGLPLKLPHVHCPGFRHNRPRRVKIGRNTGEPTSRSGTCTCKKSKRMGEYNLGIEMPVGALYIRIAAQITTRQRPGNQALQELTPEPMLG